MSSDSAGRALPLVYQDEKTGKFKVGEDAIRFLQGFQDEIAVAIVAGRYRSGKSFLMNKLLPKAGDFSVGHTIESHTKGIFLSNSAVDAATPDGRPIKLLLMDSEGLGAIDKGKDEHYDTTIFSLATLLCSTLIFNGASQIDEGSIQQLGFISNLTKHIRVKSATGKESDASATAASGQKGAEEENAADLEPFFPQFVWVLRDFSLRLEDDDYNEITADQYLEKSLSDVQGFDQATTARNRIRKALRLFFRRRRCFPLVRPVEDEEKLQGLDDVPEGELREEFKEGMAHLKEHIYGAALPKRLGSRSVNGPILAGLVRSYVDAINGGGVPSIADAWESAAGDQCTRLADSVIAWVDARLSLASAGGSDAGPSSGAGAGAAAPEPSQGTAGMATEAAADASGVNTALDVLPMEEKDLQDAVKEVHADALRRFDNSAPSGAPIPVKRERARIVEHLQEIALDLDRANSTASREGCKALCGDLRDKHLQPVVISARKVLEEAQKGQADTVQQIDSASKELQAGRSKELTDGESSGSDPASQAEKLRSLADTGLASLRAHRVSIGELQGQLLRNWTLLQQEYTRLARGPAKFAVLLDSGTPLLLESQSEAARCQAQITEAGLAVATTAHDAAHAASQKLIDDVKLEQSRSKALSSDLQSTRTTLRKAEGELEGTKQRNASLQAEVEQERSDREKLESELSEKKHSASLLEKRAERAITDAKETQESLDQALEREKEGRRAEADLRSKLEEAMRAKSSADSELAELSEQLQATKSRGAGLDAELAKLRQTCADQTRRLKDYEKEKEQQSRSLESTHRLLSKTAAERDDLQARLEKLEAENASADAELKRQKAGAAKERSSVAKLEAKCAELEETVARLERELGDSKRGANRLKEELAEAQARSKEEKQTLTKALHKSKEEVELVMKSAQEESDQMERDHAAKLDEASKKQAELKQAISEANEAISKMDEKIAELQSQLDARSSQVEELKAGLSALEAEREQAKSESEAKLLAVRTEGKTQQEDLQHKLETATARLEEGAQQVRGLEKRLREAEAARDEAQKKSMQSTSEASELLSASKDREKALAVELAEARAVMTAAEAHTVDLRSQLQREQERLHESESDRSNLRKALEEVRDGGREDARRSEARSRELEDSIREATQALDAANDMIESKKSEIAELKDSTRQQGIRADSLAEQLHLEQQARRDADQELDRMQHEGETAAARLLTLEQGLSDANRQVEQLEAEVRQVKQSHEDAQRENEKKERRIDELQKDLRDARELARQADAHAEEAKSRSHKEEARVKTTASRLQRDLDAAREREEKLKGDLSHLRLAAARSNGVVQVLTKRLEERESDGSAAKQDAHGMKVKLLELQLRSSQSSRRRDETIRNLKKAQRAARLRERRRLDVDSAMDALRQGALLTKYAAHKEGEKQRRWVALAASGSEIGWCAPHKRVFTSSVRLADVTGVGLGTGSPVFQSAAAKPEDEQCCLTLYSAERSFDFECADTDEAVTWVFGIRCLLLERAGSGRYSLSKVVVRLEAASLRLAAASRAKEASPQALLNSWRARARVELAPQLLAAAHSKAVRRLEEQRSRSKEAALSRELMRAKALQHQHEHEAAVAQSSGADHGIGGTPAVEGSASSVPGSADDSPTPRVSRELPAHRLQPTEQEMQDAGAAAVGSPLPGASPGSGTSLSPAQDEQVGVGSASRVAAVEDQNRGHSESIEPNAQETRASGNGEQTSAADDESQAAPASEHTQLPSTVQPASEARVDLSHQAGPGVGAGAGDSRMKSTADDALQASDESEEDSDEANKSASGAVPHRKAPAAPGVRRAGSWLSGGRVQQKSRGSQPPVAAAEPNLATAVADFRKQRQLVAQIDAEEEGHAVGASAPAGASSLSAGTPAGNEDVLAGSPLARRLDPKGRLQMHSSSEEELADSAGAGGVQDDEQTGKRSVFAESIASDELSLAGGGHQRRYRLPQGSRRLRKQGRPGSASKASHSPDGMARIEEES